MHITDTVADMLTRIRNANSAKHETVDIPASNMKKAIAQILLDEGYIKSRALSASPSSTAPTSPRSSPDSAGYPSPVCASTPAARICPE